MNAHERALRNGQRQRTPAEIIRDLQTGATSLQDQLRFWSAILPRDSTISTAQATVTGLQRTLSELRLAMRAHDAPQRAA